LTTRRQRVAIITGASQGIGSALVDAYRRLDYAVVVNSRSIAPGDDPNVAVSRVTLPTPRPLRTL
jgi:NAD(P)-dependent dehydrogenase (short-subunit alcohol dehydrogenase family)